MLMLDLMLQKHQLQITIVMTFKGTNKFGHPHWEDDTMCNYAHGPSMSNHLKPPTTILQKVKPFAHVK
jgi:hypothetical protein